MKTYRITLSRTITRWSEEWEVQALDMEDACDQVLAYEDKIEFFSEGEDISPASVSTITIITEDGDEIEADPPAPYATRSLSTWSDAALIEELQNRGRLAMFRAPPNR